MKHEVVEAVSQLMREKGIDKEMFEEIIESVFMAMIKRKYNRTENFTVTFNVDKGDIEIQCIKMVVPDGEVIEESEHISLSEAKSYDPYAEVGEETVVFIDYEKEFGRRIIISAKQNLMQRIREIEKENMFAEFNKRVGEIVIGDIHQITRNEIRLNIDKTEVVMPRNQQVPNERYRRGETLKAIILDVNRTARDPEIIVSRRDTSFVRRLFELEVPEIFDGIVEIKSIAREAGERTKIAVDTNDPRIDPVGACVGMKGVRIQAIVKELNREKIDIIHWTNDRELMIRRALNPVIPLELVFLEGGNKVMAIIRDDQIAQAIGKRGQNIRLASNLAGYDIEPVRSSAYYQEEEEELAISDIEGLPPDQLELLKNAGFNTAEEIVTDGLEAFTTKAGIDHETAAKIFELVSGYFEETEENEEPEQ